MAALVIASAIGLGAAAYIYSGTIYPEDATVASRTRPIGYNPYILNQFQTIRDTIYSASLAENRIHDKPGHVTDGVYGISEYHLKLSPGDPFTVTTQKTNLNR